MTNIAIATGIHQARGNAFGYHLVPQNPPPVGHGHTSPYSSESPAQDGHGRMKLQNSLSLQAGEDIHNAQCGSLLTSVKYQLFSAFLILANAIVIGLETDLSDLDCWNYLEQFFLVAFTFELIMRIVIITPTAFFNSDGADFSWNLFDVAVVSIGVLDSMMSLLSGNRTSMGGATVFRIVRLLRILRIFRIVKFLKQLYMLAFGFAMAAEAVFWVTFLMMFVLYVSSIILVRTVGQSPTEDAQSEFLNRKFGSILRSMTTLFELMAVPEVEPFQEVLVQRPLMAAFFVAYVIFGSFGMIALLTGVISEGMFEKNRVRAEEDRMEREAMRKMLGQKCFELFNDLDHDAEGDAKKDDIAKLLPEIGKVFEENGIFFTHHDLAEMLQLIDTDGSGTISREEFRHFILSMSEGVTPIQMLEIYYSIAVLQSKQDEDDKSKREFEVVVKDRLRELKGQMQEFAAGQRAANDAERNQEDTSARLCRCEDSLVELTSHVKNLQGDMRNLMGQLDAQSAKKHESNGSGKWSFGGARSKSPQ